MAKKSTMPAPSATPMLEPDAANYLTTEALGATGKATLTILSEPRASSSQYAVGGWDLDVRIGRIEYVWTIKPNSGNHRRLWKQTGGKLKGKSVSVCIKQHMNKDYVAVAD